MAIFSYIAATAWWASFTAAAGISAATASAIIATGQAATWALASALVAKSRVSRQEMMATLDQTDQPRTRGYGRNLMGGVRAFFEADDGRLYQIVVVHHGRVDGVIGFWIDGRKVTWNAETGEVQRYKYLFFRDGSGQGGDYPPVRAEFPDLWTADHRLQGQATFCSVWGDPSDEDFSKVFPRGSGTQVQVEIRGSLVTNLQGALIYSENAGLCIRDFMTHADGWAIAQARLDPASWAAFVALSNEAVQLATGGTEPRYRLCGYYSLEDPLKDVTARMLSTCDGQIFETADGLVGIVGGAWSEPDVTITDDDILSVQMGDGFDPFADYNVQVGSFVSPAHGYQPTALAEWTDTAALATQGRRVKQVDIDMSPSGPQTQRLLKIARAKDRRDQLGSIRTNLVGMKARFPKGDGIHTIRLAAPLFGLEGVFEVISHRFSVPDGFCDIGLGSIVNPYPWNAATEEKAVPPTLAQINSPVNAAPVPVGAVLVQDTVTVTGDVSGVKLVLSVNDPAREGLELIAQVAIGNHAPNGPYGSPAPLWVAMPATQLRAETGLLNDGAEYTVRYRWKTATLWNKAGPITVRSNPATPPIPTSFTAVKSGTNTVMEWINAPTDYYRTQIFMTLTSAFTNPVLLATVAGNPGRADGYTHPTGTTTGTRHFWARTLNRSGVLSTPPVGPRSLFF